MFHSTHATPRRLLSLLCDVVTCPSRRTSVTRQSVSSNKLITKAKITRPAPAVLRNATTTSSSSNRSPIGTQRQWRIGWRPGCRGRQPKTPGTHPWVTLGSDPGIAVAWARPVGRYRERIRSQLRVGPRVWPRAGLPLGLGVLPKQKQCGRPRRLGPVAAGAHCALGNLRAAPGRRKATRPALRRRLVLSVWVWITNRWLSCPALQAGGRAVDAFISSSTSSTAPRRTIKDREGQAGPSSNCAGTD
jgi:hypothetical protein